LVLAAKSEFDGKVKTTADFETHHAEEWKAVYLKTDYIDLYQIHTADR
jgi:aryl-alcohol dehydrogenase-like predicted oxidoreductase